MGTAVDDALRDATGEFLAFARREPSLLDAAAESLTELSLSTPSGAAWLAIALGACAESNGTAAVTAPRLLELFRDWLGRLPRPESEAARAEEPAPTRLQASLLEAFPDLCRSVVAHLARLPQERLVLASDTELLARLEGLGEYGPGAEWVHAALLKSSGRLLALHPQSKKAALLRYENVSNCFHLFSLVQGAIGQRIPGGREQDATIAAAARGQTTASAFDTAWWHYGDPRSATPEIGASIWGEASPRSIPLLDGVQVLLLWPQLLASRGWESAFFRPHLEALPASAVLEEWLPDGAVRDWMQRLAIESTRRWWKLW